MESRTVVEVGKAGMGFPESKSRRLPEGRHATIVPAWGGPQATEAPGLPVLVRGSHIEFERPGPARLMVEEDKAIDDALDADQPLFAAGCIGEAFSDLFTTDRTIDHHVADMDTVTCVFLRHRLRQRAKPALDELNAP